MTTLARVEDAALLTGQGRFLDDLDPLPGTLVAAIVRSPHAHARIRSVNLDRARSRPGVAALIGPEEVLATLKPFPLSVKAPTSYYPTATDKTRFVGEPVAVVVATDRYLAEDAAEFVDIDYEPLPAVVRTDRALEPDAPLLHEQADSNVATDRTFTFGDVDRAFADAKHIVRREYSFPRYSSTPMECYVVIAEWRDGSNIRVTGNHFSGPGFFNGVQINSDNTRASVAKNIEIDHNVIIGEGSMVFGVQVDGDAGLDTISIHDNMIVGTSSFAIYVSGSGTALSIVGNRSSGAVGQWHLGHAFAVYGVALQDVVLPGAFSCCYALK